MFLIALATFQRAYDEFARFIGSHSELPTIDAKIIVACEESHSLITVNEGMVTDQQFEHCSCHLRQIFVVARLRPEQSGSQKTYIPHALRSAKFFKQTCMTANGFVQ